MSTEVQKEWSDSEFCHYLGFDAGIERKICLSIRATTARECRLRREDIGPETDTQFLANRTRGGWENIAVVLALEQEFGVAIPVEEDGLPNFTLMRFFWFRKRPKPANYAEWVKRAVEVLAPMVAKQARENGYEVT